MFNKISESLSNLVGEVRELRKLKQDEFDWRKSQIGLVTKQDLREMEKRMSLKVSEIKTAVAALTKNNKEAFTEVGNLIAVLNKQIEDLIAGVGDPTVTDEAFESDLKAAGESSQALADIVPGTPEPPA